MKTLFMVLAVAVLVLSVPTVSYAGEERAAVVINRGTGLCGMPGADANGDITFGGVGYAKVVLENSNKIMLKCDGEGITNLSGSGQQFSGFSCGIIAPDGLTFVITTDSHATVSASGKGSMTCTYKKP